MQIEIQNSPTSNAIFLVSPERSYSCHYSQLSVQIVIFLPIRVYFTQMDLKVSHISNKVLIKKSANRNFCSSWLKFLLKYSKNYLVKMSYKVIKTLLLRSTQPQYIVRDVFQKPVLFLLVQSELLWTGYPTVIM